MSDCPSDVTLTGYLEDALVPATAARVTLHIDTCKDCQARLDFITTESVVIDRYKNLSSVIERGGKVVVSVKPANPANATQVLGDGVMPMVPIMEPVIPTVPGYTIACELGRGGMGVVYQAHHKRLNRTVALKMILAGGLADPRVTQRFLFEAEVLALVQHPQVVQVYEVNMYTTPTGVTIPYLSMELLDNGTLLDWAGGEKKPPREAAELVEGLARAVHAAHSQGVIHRDLKPANILRAKDGRFKVGDFGLAKLIQTTGSDLTGSGTVVGTPAYMAPEQAGGAKQVGTAADVYSLGAILFELLTGRPPFEGTEPMSVLMRVINESPPEVRTVRPDLPRDLAAVVMKCLTKEPHRRYHSAEHLANDLQRFRENRPTRARGHSTVERVWYWSRRNPAVATLVSALAVVLMAGFGSVLWMWVRAEDTAEQMRQARDHVGLLADHAQRASEAADSQRRAADTRGAFLAFNQAVRWCEAGQIDDGLREFVRALELAERTDLTDLRRVIRVNLAAWDRELFPAGRLIAHPESSHLQTSGFSPDGKWVYTVGSDARVRVWDCDTGVKTGEYAFDWEGADVRKLLRVLPKVKDLVSTRPHVRSVAISRDRKRIAAGTSDGALVFWTVGKEEPVKTVRVPTLVGQGSDFWGIQFAPDGTVWAGGDNGWLFRYDPATGERLATITLPDPPEQGDDPSVQVIRLSEDGKRLFTGDRSRRLIEWDTDTRKVLRQWETRGWVSDAAVSPDGEFVAATGTCGQAIVWSRTTGRVVWTIDLAGAYGSTVAWGGDGRHLIVGDQDGRVRVWDFVTRIPVGGPMRIGLQGKRVEVRAGSGELLLPKERAVRIQPILGSRVVPVVPYKYDFESRVRVLDFHPVGSELLVGAGHLRLVNADDGKAVRDLPLAFESLAAKFDQSGRRVQYGYRGGWGLFDLTTNAVAFQNKVAHAYVHIIPTRPADKTASVFLRQELQRWSADGTYQASVSPQRGDKPDLAATTVVLSPDLRQMRVAVADRIEFADATTGKPTRPAIEATDEIRDLTQSADGRFVVAGLRDNSVQMWDVETGAARFALPARHSAAVTTVAISPDGRVLLSGSRDRTAQFWDAITGLALGPKMNHAQPVTVATFSPDGRRVATGTSSGLAVVWPVPPPADETPVGELRSRYRDLVGCAKPGTKLNR